MKYQTIVIRADVADGKIAAATELAVRREHLSLIEQIKHRLSRQFARGVGEEIPDADVKVETLTGSAGWGLDTLVVKMEIEVERFDHHIEFIDSNGRTLAGDFRSVLGRILDASDEEIAVRVML